MANTYFKVTFFLLFSLAQNISPANASPRNSPHSSPQKKKTKQKESENLKDIESFNIENKFSILQNYSDKIEFNFNSKNITCRITLSMDKISSGELMSDFIKTSLLIWNFIERNELLRTSNNPKPKLSQLILCLEQDLSAETKVAILNAFVIANQNLQRAQWKNIEFKDPNPLKSDNCKDFCETYQRDPIIMNSQNQGSLKILTNDGWTGLHQQSFYNSPQTFNSCLQTTYQDSRIIIKNTLQFEQFLLKSNDQGETFLSLISNDKLRLLEKVREAAIYFYEGEALHSTSNDSLEKIELISNLNFLISTAVQNLNQ